MREGFPHHFHAVQLKIMDTNLRKKSTVSEFNASVIAMVI